MLFFAFNIMNQEYLDIGNITQPRSLEDLFSFITSENEIETQNSSLQIHIHTHNSQKEH